MKRVYSFKVFFVFLICLGILGIVGTYYFYNRYQQSLDASPTANFLHERKAILYRPTENKIIEIQPIHIAPAVSPQAGAVLEKQSPLRVVLENSYGASQAASLLKNELVKQMSTLTFITGQSAVYRYPRTVVIDLSMNHKDVATQLAARIHGEVVTLPVNERRPDADILIILGTSIH